MQNFLIFISEQWILVSLLLITVYVFIWNESKKSGLPLTTQQLIQSMNKEQAVVLDLRDSKDYKQGHIAGAIHFQFNEVQSRNKEIEKMQGKKIVLVDKLGQGTGQFANYLKAKGFEVLKLKGGMTQWYSENLPVAVK